jgi:hypothetical protein
MNLCTSSHSSTLSSLSALSSHQHHLMSKLISIEHELSNHLKYTDQDQLQLKHFGKNLTLQAKQLNRDS